MNVKGLMKLLEAMEDYEQVMMRVDGKELIPIPSVEEADTGTKTLYLNDKPVKGYHY